MSNNIYYDNAYNMTLCNVQGISYSNSYGAFAGNGKLAFYTSLKTIGTDHEMISQTFQNDQIGRYKNNTINVFNANTITLCSRSLDDTNIQYDFVRQTLDMYDGSVESEFTTLSNNINIATVKSKVRPLRNYPYCMLNSITITPSSTLTSSQSNLDIYHHLISDPQMVDATYNNTFIYNEALPNNESMYICTADGLISRLQCKVTSSCTYIFDQPASSKIMGFNATNNTASSFQRIQFTDIDSTSDITFHIITCHMTNFDFKLATDESKRILLNLVVQQKNAESVPSGIIEANTLAWENIWDSVDITIRPKDGVVAEELAKLYSMQMYIRRALFHVFSCVRDIANTDVNPLNLSYVDTNGNIFFDGDLWLMPVLIILKPNIAKTLLEFRYKTIEQSMQLAASIGYDGSKYPYVNDVLGYNNIYWDVISPLHIFNNALIAINVWNYYRISELPDKDWLGSKGYSIMRNISNFFVAYAKRSNPNLESINNVLGLDDTNSDNHTLTNYMVLLSLKYTIEASYALGLPVTPAWLTLYNRLSFPIFNDATNFDVIKYNGSYTGAPIKLLENLIPLFPHYNSYWMDTSLKGNDKYLIVKKNLNYYSSRIEETFADHPINKFLQSALYAYVGQSDEAFLPTFYDAIQDSVATTGKGPWQFLTSGTQDTRNKFAVDVSVDAMLLLVVLSSVCGVQIRGGYNPNRTLYLPLNFLCDLSSKMPPSWLDIQLNGLGINSRPFIVTNVAT
jgi:protein-glucosylgalactosylhydroxylysine glucosidase